MGLILWLAKWFFFILICSWLLLPLVSSVGLLRHPSDSQNQMPPPPASTGFLALGVLAGWLWFHLSVKYPAKSSGKVMAKIQSFGRRWQDWNEASYSDEVRNWGLEKARHFSEVWSRITGIFFLWMLFFPKVPPGVQLFYLMVGIWIGG